MDKNLSTVPVKRQRQFGDRSDGWRVYSRDPFFSVIPHIMKMRCDSQVYFDQVIDITELEKFIRNTRHNSSMAQLSTLHLIMAACVRMFAKYPCVNRFVSGRRIYARNKIIFSFCIKKDMSLDAEETTVKVEFDPMDSLEDVYNKVTAAITANKGSEAENDTDMFAKLLSFCPVSLVKLIVFLADKLDQHGMLPKAIHDFSPFHCSMFLTDIGSIGIGSVYHHLYNFGNCTVFCALGKKGRALKMDDDGKIVYGRTLNLRFTVDERVTDGYYYAYTFREFLKLLRHPETLLEKPDEVVIDPGLRKTHKEKRALKKQRKLEKKAGNVA